MVVSGCSANPTPVADPSTAAAGAYLAGDYQCEVITTVGGGGFAIDGLYIGGSHGYFGGGELHIGSDGSWTAPDTSGTWALNGHTITVALNEASGKISTVDVPGFPVTADAAFAGTTLVVAHPTYSGGRSPITARMDAGGFTLTNEDRDSLRCARS